MKKSGGKYQCSVLFMVISVIAICVSSASLTLFSITEKHADGVPVFDFQGYCSD